ncbi:hypothetical protein INR75_02950 [Zunongwangia sp. SCSIO 43204]|uniref:hypothetical protein n=1 Tax=Zunongwangia sp. SCSIO 43204 TaxID=2779359 RepID=UPI001CA9819C|nr:hypothetical protein [Zunongwangia sp. SCSIO 43204]UAB85005.1 hypothetical protein INR75_02950 [Zunongwangia sp. SCSIO 43204]
MKDLFKYKRYKTTYDPLGWSGNGQYVIKTDDEAETPLAVVMVPFGGKDAKDRTKNRANHIAELLNNNRHIIPDNHFCKIYSIDDNQILVQLKLNDDGDLGISQVTKINGCFVEALIDGFEENGTTAEKQFKKYTINQAGNFLTAMQKFMSNGDH